MKKETMLKDVLNKELFDDDFLKKYWHNMNCVIRRAGLKRS